MDHALDIEHACRYGDREAIAIDAFQWWISNHRSNREFRQPISAADPTSDRTWCWRDLDSMEEHFPYWTRAELQETIRSLICQGVLIMATEDSPSADLAQTAQALAKMPPYGESFGAWYCFRDEKGFLGR